MSLFSLLFASDDERRGVQNFDSDHAFLLINVKNDGHFIGLIRDDIGDLFAILDQVDLHCIALGAESPMGCQRRERLGCRGKIKKVTPQIFGYLTELQTDQLGLIIKASSNEGFGDQGLPGARGNACGFHEEDPKFVLEWTIAILHVVPKRQRESWCRHIIFLITFI